MKIEVLKWSFSRETWDKILDVINTKEQLRAEDHRDIKIKILHDYGSAIGTNIYLVFNDREYDVTDYGNW